MTDNNSQNGSNDNELNVLVAALGLTGNSRYVGDMEALADRAEKAIKSVAGINGRRVDNVVVRENYDLCQLLEERMEGEALPDVQYYGVDWRRMLDDTPESYDNGKKQTLGVMLNAEQKAERAGEDADPSDFEDDVPIADIVSGGDEFDLHDRDDRTSIDMSLIDQKRINRAKARARGKTDERLYNDYFDRVPTVTEAIFLNDGTNRGIAAVEAARGINPFVKYATACQGNVLEVSCNKDGDQIIDWARYLLETGKIEADELTEAQETHLRETYSDDDLEYMGLSVEAEVEEPTVEADAEPEREDVQAAEAAAVAGAEPASAD